MIISLTDDEVNYLRQLLLGDLTASIGVRAKCDRRQDFKTLETADRWITSASQLLYHLEGQRPSDAAARNFISSMLADDAGDPDMSFGAVAEPRAHGVSDADHNAALDPKCVHNKRFSERCEYCEKVEERSNPPPGPVSPNSRNEAGIAADEMFRFTE